eukprot:7603260-Pyramimonas_sp.AAC.2
MAMVTGRAWVAGAPWNKLTGDNMTVRKDHMANMTANNFKAFAAGVGGFCVLAEPGSLVCVPAGMMVFTAVPGGDAASWLRWGVLGKGDIVTVAGSLSEMLSSYPYLGTTDYSTLASLTAHAVGHRVSGLAGRDFWLPASVAAAGGGGGVSRPSAGEIDPQRGAAPAVKSREIDRITKQLKPTS